MKQLLTILLVHSCALSYSQKVLCENTLKISGTGSETFYYAFKKGDVIGFEFEVVKGKNLKEISIKGEGGSMLFSDFKASSITNKMIPVTSTGIYRFHFNNGAVGGKICKIKIMRIPDEPDDFNSTVYYETIRDTTWVSKTRQELERIDTVFHESSSFEGNKMTINSRMHHSCMGNSASCTKNKIHITYPDDTEELMVLIMTDPKVAEKYSQMSKSVVKIGVKAGLAASTMGTSFIAEMMTNSSADKVIDEFPTTGTSNIDVTFTDQTNANSWYTDYNNGINPYPGLQYKNRSMIKIKLIKKQLPKDGMYVCLKNNHTTAPAVVNIGIVAMRLIKIYKTVSYKVPEVKIWQKPYLKN